MKFRLKELREAAGMTQGELGSRLGIKVSNISKYELGKTEPTQETLVRIAALFDVSVDYLLGASNFPGGSEDRDFIYIMGSDGQRHKKYIPPQQVDRLRSLLSAGIPELMED